MSNRILAVTVGPAGASTPAGLKCQVFNQPLSGVDLLVGPNGAGKTTRGPLAITAALEGLATVPTDPRRPYVGPLPEATAVSLDVQTATGVERLTRVLDVAKGKAVATADQRARDLVGVPPTAWDLRDFATATGGGRASILDAVARAGGALERWDAPRAQEHVRALHADAMPEDTDDTDAWAAPVERLISALDAAPDGATWLQAAEVWTTNQQKTTNAAQKEAYGHLGGVNGEAATPPEGDRKADEAAHTAALKRQALLDRAADDLAAAKAARERHAEEGKRAKAALDAAKEEGQRLAQPLTVELGEYTQRLADAEAQRHAPIPPCEHNAVELRAEIATAQAALAQAEDTGRARIKAQAEVDALEGVGSAVDLDGRAARLAEAEAEAALFPADGADGRNPSEAEIDAARTEVTEATEAEGVRLQAVSEVATLESVSGADATCRHCHAADPLGIAADLQAARERLAALPTAAAEPVRQRLRDLEARRRAAEAYENDVRDLQAAVDAARADLARAQEREEGRTRDMQAARDRLAALPVLDAAPIRASLRDLQARLATAEAYEKTIRAARQTAIDSARTELERAQKRHEAAEKQRVDALATARENWKKAKAALDKWEAVAAPTLPDVSDDAREEIAAALAAAEARLSVWRDHDDVRRRTAAAAERYRTARLEWDATRALLAAVRQARDDVAAAAYRPIHDAARALLADATDLPQPFFKGPDDYGADVQGRGHVPYAGLSESEQRITAAALVYALATVAGCPCRLVLLDGLEVVQRDHRAPLVAALAKAQQAGKVDSVVLTMALSPGEPLGDLEAVEGLTVHRIERVAHVPPVRPAVQPEAVHRDVKPANTGGDECPF